MLLFVLCLLPAVVFSLELEDLPRIDSVQVLSQCRTQCIKKFIPDYYLHVSASLDVMCQGDKRCYSCWDFCLILERFEGEPAVCKDEFFCGAGCKTACRFQKKYVPEVFVPPGSLTELPDFSYDNAIASWSDVDESRNSRSIVFYSIFIHHQDKWTFLSQTTDLWSELSSAVVFDKLAVVASNKSQVIALAEESFETEQRIPEPVVNTPHTGKFLKYAEPFRSINPDRYMTVADIRELLDGSGAAPQRNYRTVQDFRELLEDENVLLQRGVRSLQQFEWNLQVLDRKVVEDMVEFRVFWNAYPLMGEYRVIILNTGDTINVQKNTATIRLPRDNLYTVQIQFKGRRRSSIISSPLLVMDTTYSLGESSTVGYLAGKVNFVAIISLSVLSSLLLLSLIGICCYTRRSKAKTNSLEAGQVLMEIMPVSRSGETTVAMAYEDDKKGDEQRNSRKPTLSRRCIPSPIDTRAAQLLDGNRLLFSAPVNRRTPLDRVFRFTPLMASNRVFNFPSPKKED